MNKIYLEKQNLNHYKRNVMSWSSGFSGLFFCKFTYYAIIFILAASFSIDIIESDLSRPWQGQDLRWFLVVFKELSADAAMAGAVEYAL